MDDLDMIASVEAECFPTAEAASKAEFEKRIHFYGNHFWLMFDGDKMYEKAELHKESGDWQMIFGVNTIPKYRRKGYAGELIQRAIADARKEGRKGLVLTCKDKLIHYYEKFGFINEGVSESVHGNAVWYQMRLTF